MPNYYTVNDIKELWGGLVTNVTIENKKAVVWCGPWLHIIIPQWPTVDNVPTPRRAKRVK